MINGHYNQRIQSILVIYDGKSLQVLLKTLQKRKEQKNEKYLLVRAYFQLCFFPCLLGDCAAVEGERFCMGS